MKLITQEIRARLLANARDRGPDHAPVLKLFTPWAGATWLITEMDPEDQDRLFGLCDLGQGFPELGYLSLAEIASVRGPGGLKIERDLHFSAWASLGAYAEAARQKQGITESRIELRCAFIRLEARAREEREKLRAWIETEGAA
jgi:hypothetical protein